MSLSFYLKRFSIYWIMGYSDIIIFNYDSKHISTHKHNGRHTSLYFIYLLGLLIAKSINKSMKRP